MIQNNHKQIYKNQGCCTQMNATESKLARMLAIDSTEEDDVSDHEKRVVLRPHRPTWKLQNTQKLGVMMAKLKKDITFVIKYGEKRNEAITEHSIFLRLDQLNKFIDQVIYIKYVTKRGGTIFLESLFAIQKKTNDTLNKIREDVLKAYFELDSEDKYNIDKQGSQMTSIFKLLGIIERELHSTYEKISQAISKKNEHRNKNNKGFTDLFSPFRSLPALKSSKCKSKERLTYIQNNDNGKKYMDNSEPDNIPPEKQKASENNEAYDHAMKYQVTDTTNNTDFTKTTLKKPITSCLDNLEENNYPEAEQSSDNELYEECTTPPEIENPEYKGTGFEINISNQNIQIKIPTSVIYLVRDSNYKSNIKSDIEQVENLVNGENGNTVYNCPIMKHCPYPSPNCSVSDFRTEKTISEESISSLYTDIMTDSEVGKDFIKDGSFQNNLVIDCKKRTNKIINYDKCIPFFSENGYCNPVTKEHELTKSIHSPLIKTDKEKMEKQTEKDPVFLLLNKNRNLTCEYENQICNLSNPIYGNIIQLVDLIKKICCDFNTKTTFDHNESLEHLSNIDKPNYLTSTFSQRYDFPPSISQSSLECPSLWKESAIRLCELCPGCVSIAKLTNEGA